ncbi:MAG: CHAD domain-containing protein [Acidobacteriota bacterium]|nr:CHAD domain-containing protein [Acidobacteriota bacterium]
MHEEWEIKLSSRVPLDPEVVGGAVRQAGFEVDDQGVHEQVDDYLDTERLDLSRGRSGLRVRARDGRRTLTFKDAGRRKGDAICRLEWVGPWEREELPSSAADLPAAVRRHVEPLIYLRPLRGLARLKTRRHAMVVRHLLSGARAELVVDRVETELGSAGAASFAELEIEALEGDTRAWRDLAERLRGDFGLEGSPGNKLEQALVLAGRDVPPPRARIPLVASMPLREAAREIFRRHFYRLQQEEPGTRLAEDIEALHDMRVASRRLRAAFRLLSGAFSAGQLDGFNRLMSRTGQVLGHARDLDVFLEALPGLRARVPEALVEDLAPFETLVTRHRLREQERILAWLSSASRLRACERFESFLERPPARARGLAMEVGQVAPGLVLSAARRVYRRGGKIGRKAPPDKLHRLRIAMKKMRYAMEDFSDLYGKRLGGFIRSCRDLQDVLGAFNDADVTLQWVGDFIERRGSRLPRRTLLAVGSLMGVLAARREEARDDFRAAWRRFDKDSVRRELNSALLSDL